jgi:sodium transport system permease protein
VRTTLTVMVKELSETLRDPLVLVMALGFPLLFFPLMIWGVTQMKMLQDGIAEATEHRIEIVGLAAPGPGGLVDALRTTPAIPGTGGVEALHADELDLLVTAQLDGSALTVELTHDSTRPRSVRALDWAEERADEARSARTAELAAGAGVEPDGLETWAIRIDNVREGQDRLIDVLAKMLPIMVFMSLILAIMAPAVDVFVGERERGTLETTLATASSRWSILLGKTLAVVGIALVAASGNFIAVGLTVLQMVATLSEKALQAPPIHWGQLGMLLPATLAFSALMVAVNFIVVLPARTFKQAQNMSSVVLIISIGAIFGQVDADSTLETWHALIPAVNLINGMTAAFRGTLDIGFAALTTVVNAGLAGLMLAFVARRMADEDYLFGTARPARWTRWLSGLGTSEGGGA